MTKFTGQFPSDEQFIGPRGTARVTGDDVRAAISELGVVHGDMLVLPSATTIAKRLGMIASGLVGVGKRVDITSAEEVLSRATGCTVIPVNGFLVDLRNLDQAPPALSEPIFSAEPGSGVGDLDDPAQRQSLANHIVNETSPAQALAFIQQLAGSLVTKFEQQTPDVGPV